MACGNNLGAVDCLVPVGREKEKQMGASSLYSLYCSRIQRRPFASVSLCFSFGAVRVLCGLVETGRPLVLESFSEIIIFLFDLRILAALLLDVLLWTPVMKGCKSLPFVWGRKIPFWAISVMPTLFGIFRQSVSK